jgi:ABC-type uncharacterized transport system permease subunit
MHERVRQSLKSHNSHPLLVNAALTRFCCVMYVGLHVCMVDYMHVHESMQLMQPSLDSLKTAFANACDLLMRWWPHAARDGEAAPADAFPEP